IGSSDTIVVRSVPCVPTPPLMRFPSVTSFRPTRPATGADTRVNSTSSLAASTAACASSTDASACRRFDARMSDSSCEMAWLASRSAARAKFFRASASRDSARSTSASARRSAARTPTGRARRPGVPILRVGHGAESAWSDHLAPGSQSSQAGRAYRPPSTGRSGNAPIVDLTASPRLISDEGLPAPSRLALALIGASALLPSGPPAAAASILQYHRDLARDGVYVDAALTRATAATLHRDPTFTATTQGATYAQPLYLDDASSGRDLILVATEENRVYALDATTGAPVWSRQLAAAVPLSALPCGNYHGWVVGIPVAAPGAVRAWRTKARGGGVWAPGGVASDGTSLFVTTGNTLGAARWGGGESIIRLRPRLVFGARRADHFTPPDWRALDANDVDLGGTAPILFDLPGAHPSALVVALGKNGKAYLANRT